MLLQHEEATIQLSGQADFPEITFTCYSTALLNMEQSTQASLGRQLVLHRVRHIYVYIHPPSSPEHSLTVWKHIYVNDLINIL